MSGSRGAIARDFAGRFAPPLSAHRWIFTSARHRAESAAFPLVLCLVRYGISAGWPRSSPRGRPLACPSGWARRCHRPLEGSPPERKSAWRPCASHSQPMKADARRPRHTRAGPFHSALPASARPALHRRRRRRSENFGAVVGAKELPIFFRQRFEQGSMPRKPALRVQKPLGLRTAGCSRWRVRPGGGCVLRCLDGVVRSVLGHRSPLVSPNITRPAVYVQHRSRAAGMFEARRGADRSSAASTLRSRPRTIRLLQARAAQSGRGAGAADPDCFPGSAPKAYAAGQRTDAWRFGPLPIRKDFRHSRPPDESR